MENLFNSDNYADSVPTELVAGNLWAWTRADITEAYPTASYTLLFRLSQLDSPYAAVEITAGKVSSAHVVEETTTDHTAGEYSWQAVVVRDSDSAEITVDSGFLTVLADLDGTPGNTASHTYQVLSAIRATILGTASEKQASYSVGGRALSLRSPAELDELEKEYSRRWSREKQDADRKAGRGSSRRVLAKMSA